MDKLKDKRTGQIFVPANQATYNDFMKTGNYEVVKEEKSKKSLD
jgi:hypothetical protein